MPAPLPRECRVCGVTRGLVKDARRPGGYRRVCRECFAGEMRLRWVAGESEARRESKARYRAANCEAIRRSEAEYRRRKRANPDPHLAAIGAAVKDWRKLHKCSQSELARLLKINQTTIS